MFVQKGPEMNLIKVFKIVIYAPSDHSETNIPDRWFTRRGAEMMKPVRIIEESATEIPESDLQYGSEWTPIGYTPSAH
jgi:hypothetical protein